MLDSLNDHLRDWQLSDPQLLVETVTSHIYTVRFENTTVILKLLTEIGQIDETSGAGALQVFDAHGAVRLLRHDTQAHLLEYADGPDLITLVDQGKDTEATMIIANVLNQLHNAPSQAESPSNSLVPLWRWFRSLFIKGSAEQALGIESIYTRGANIAEWLLANPQHERTLHGDIHHQNIRYHAQRGWLAFDPKGLYGERTYDVANTLCNPIDRPELVYDEVRFMKTAIILADQMGLELSRLLAFTVVYTALSASWSLEFDGNPAHALKMAVMAEKAFWLIAHHNQQKSTIDEYQWI